MSELPAGWALTRLDNVAHWGSGGTPSRKDANYYGGGIPWLKTGELGPQIITSTEETISALGLANSSAKIFPAGSVVIAMYGATIGKTSMLGIDSSTNQACAVGVSNKSLILNKYLYYYLSSQRELFVLAGKGGAQPNISQSVIREWEIPLAPVNEQKRIADKLDSLLERVDACRERLDRVPGILKRFRQAVLAAATSGELTREWRLQRGIIDEMQGFDFDDADAFAGYLFPRSWTSRRLSEIASIAGGVTKDSKKQAAHYVEIPYLRVANVQRGYLDLSEVKTIRIPPERADELLLKKGDVLFNEGGDIDKLGRGWIWNGELDKCSFQNHVFRARLHDQEFEPSYFSWYGNSRGYDYFLTRGKQTTNLASINKSVLSALPVAVPPAEEQSEIVRRVRLLLNYADGLARKSASVSQQVLALTPASLAKAFRGELVPQDPNDEPASELLARIRAAGTEPPTVKRGRKAGAR